MPGDQDYSLIERLSRARHPEMDEEASDWFVLARDILSPVDGALVEMEGIGDD